MFSPVQAVSFLPLANLVQECKIYSKQVLVNDINWIINSDKFSHSYDDLYLGVNFGGHRV